MKSKIQFIPLFLLLINIFIYLIFHFLFKYDLNRALYYEFHTNIIPMLILGNVLLSILIFTILYLKKKYEIMYYSLIPILFYILLLIISLIVVFR